MSTLNRPLWARGLSERDYDLAERGYFTIEAAAGYLGGVSARWVYQQIKDGSLRAKKVGKGYRIQKADLDKILAGEGG